MRDLHHQAEVGADHEGARFLVALFDFRGELDLLIRRQKRDLPDLAQVNLYSSIAIFSSHITFHVVGVRGEELAAVRLQRFPNSCRMRVVSFQKVVNNLKYRLNDYFRTWIVQNDFFGESKPHFSPYAKGMVFTGIG